MHQTKLSTTLEAIAVEDAKGKPRKPDQIRQELHSKGITSKPQDRHVIYWLSLRNSAAHGDYAEYSSADIKAMLGDVRAFIDSMPA